MSNPFRSFSFKTVEIFVADLYFSTNFNESLRNLKLEILNNSISLNY